MDKLRTVAPHGQFGGDLDEHEFRAAYLQGLDDHADKVVAELADLVRRHPRQPLVVMCFDDLDAGRFCHRSMWAGWMAERFGIEVDEVGGRPAAPETGQLQLPI